ncbi:MAG: sulfur carrier protein ThiS [Polynucleobacter sp.]|jgi:sulfur carrier protein|nr:sulfur carrier protein ThiS [Polynucleobacter sp.]
MRVIVNQIPRDLNADTSLTELLEAIEATPPFAVAVNWNFVPKNEHDTLILKENDEIEVISPVTGG